MAAATFFSMTLIGTYKRFRCRLFRGLCKCGVDVRSVERHTGRPGFRVENSEGV